MQLKARSQVHGDLGLITQPCLPEAFAKTSGAGKATNPWDFSDLFLFFLASPGHSQKEDGYNVGP